MAAGRLGGAAPPADQRKTPELVDVVRRLEQSPSVEAALTDAGVPESHWPAYVAALEGLATGGMISRRDPA